MQTASSARGHKWFKSEECLWRVRVRAWFHQLVTPTRAVLRQVGDEALQQALTEARVEAQSAYSDLAAVRAELEALRRHAGSPDPGSPAREPGVPGSGSPVSADAMLGCSFRDEGLIRGGAGLI